MGPETVRCFWYSVIGADLDYGVHAHPQDEMRRLGFKLLYSIPEPIADGWVFKVSGGPDEVPGYLSELKPDHVDKLLAAREESRWVSSIPREPPTHKPDGSLTDYGRYKLYGQLPVRK